MATLSKKFMADSGKINKKVSQSNTLLPEEKLNQGKALMRWRKTFPPGWWKTRRALWLVVLAVLPEIIIGLVILGGWLLR